MDEENYYDNVEFTTVSRRVQQQGKPCTSTAKGVKKTKEPAARPLLLKAGIAIIVIGLLVVIIMLASQIFLEENVQVKQAAENQKTGNNFLALEERIKNESQISQGKMQEMLKVMMDNLQSSNQDAQKEFQEIKTAVKENHETSLKILEILEKQFNKSSITSCSKVNESEAKIWNGTGGVFDIYPPGLYGQSLEVYCDTTTDGGGWLVFQRRMDGSVDFYRNWADYVTGFGNKQGEFWLGLETLHKLTRSGNYELRVDLKDWLNYTSYAEYSSFKISDASSKYQLNIGLYSGTAGDRFSYHNGQKFTTNDQDNDLASNNCAQSWKGAWWYNNCHHTNLNGNYAILNSCQGITWRADCKSMKFSEMKIRLQ